MCELRFINKNNEFALKRAQLDEHYRKFEK